MATWPWIERKFVFEYPPGKFPDLLERLRGTPARVEERVRGLPREVLTHSDGGWSIQENIGHLLDAEDLPRRRLEQLLAGADQLVAADMSNRRTHAADHNARETAELLAGFRRQRRALVEQFEQLASEDWGRAALHPRLGQPMRIVDLVCFTCEHDDYHLARIGELIRKFAAAVRP